MRGDWESIAQEYGCEELWLGGDIGNAEDFSAYLSYDFDRIKAVVGDEDRKSDLGDGEKGWYAHEIEKHGSLDHMNNLYGVDVGETVADPVTAAQPYEVVMGHDPEVFGIDYYNEGAVSPACISHALDEPKVVLYGHKHRPFARTVQNSVAIGMGSTYKNYEVKGEMPERSLYVLELGDAVEVYHIDLEPDDEDRSWKEVERQRFERAGDGFQEVRVADEAPIDVGNRFKNLPEVAAD